MTVFFLLLSQVNMFYLTIIKVYYYYLLFSINNKNNNNDEKKTDNRILIDAKNRYSKLVFPFHAFRM